MKTPFIILLLLPFSLIAETFKPVQVDSDRVLVYPTDFFAKNSNALNSAVSANAGATGKLDATNGVAVNMSVTSLIANGLSATNATFAGTVTASSGSTINVASGASFVAAPGSSVTAPKVSLTGDTSGFASTDAITKGYVDQESTVSRVYTDVRSVDIVDNMSELQALGVSNTYAKVAVVRFNTGYDGAQGYWLWDPIATAVESARIKRANSVPSGAGRWVKQ